MHRFLAIMTGGRPMDQLEHFFTDRLTGRDVYFFRDAFGRLWMASYPWSIFRFKLFKRIPFFTERQT